MIVITARLYSYFQQDRESVLQAKLPQESKIIHLLEKLNIPTVEIGALVVKNRNATLQTKLNDGDIVTLIPHIVRGWEEKHVKE